MRRYLFPLLTLIFLVPASALISSAQDERVTLDQSKVPSEGRKPSDFVPAGWKIENEVAGDLNGDSSSDVVLKLVEDKPEKDKDGDPTERQRALVILFRNEAGGYVRAGVAGTILQCTRCGGAFYGVVETPANVKIERGSVVIDQDHGSRDVTSTVYRFRYEGEAGEFVLIGFDYNDADRATGMNVSESTNYLTGVRIVTRGRGKKDSTSKTQVGRKRIFIGDLDSDKFEEEAAQRLHLD